MAIPNRFSLHSLASTKPVPKDARGSLHSQHDSQRSSAVKDSWPVHPIPCMRGPFQESIIEAMDPDARIRQTLDAATRRLQLLELDDPKEEHYSTRWRRKPGAKFHPLWKLIAQISFGVHLLHQQIAKSEEEVIRILQTHVDEIDGFLEDAGADFDLAMRDIDERLRLLLLPLEHGRTFNKMLRDREFRISIIEGNDIIERICTRTNKAMSKSLDDVEKGLEATAELAKFLDRLSKDWNDRDEDMQSVYTAMRGNSEGWFVAFTDIKKKGEKLKRMIRRLERIVAEVERQAGIASRRKIRQQQATADTSSDKTTAEKTPYETPADLSRVVSPAHSRSPSSYRASLNKPLPPDPTRRSSKQHQETRRRSSTPMTNINPSSQDFHSAREQPAENNPYQSRDNEPVKGDQRPKHSAKPSQDSHMILQLGVDLPIELDTYKTPDREAEGIDASQIPLPLSPSSSTNTSHEPVELEANPAKRDSPEKLIQQAIPNAHVPELHIPSVPRPKSHVADKHQSASIVEAYNQSKPPSRSSSRRVISDSPSPASAKIPSVQVSDAAPPRISLHLGFLDQTKNSPVSPLFKDTKIDAAKSNEGKGGHVLTEVDEAKPDESRSNGVPVKDDSVAKNNHEPEPGLEEVPSTSTALDTNTNEPNEKSAPSKTAEEAVGRTSIGSVHRATHSMSSAGDRSMAQESTAVNRPRSRGSDPPGVHRRTISMNAFGPAPNGISDSNLPEIIVEPQDPEGEDASVKNGESVSPPAPMTPPLPDRSPARASPRSGGRSPVSYKLMPDVRTPPPGEEVMSPKTALPQKPQWPKPEQHKRFKKPSINVFRGVLFKKNSSRPLGSGGLGGHIAIA